MEVAGEQEKFSYRSLNIAYLSLLTNPWKSSKWEDTSFQKCIMKWSLKKKNQQINLRVFFLPLEYRKSKIHIPSNRQQYQHIPKVIGTATLKKPKQFSGFITTFDLKKNILEISFTKFDSTEPFSSALQIGKCLICNSGKCGGFYFQTVRCGAALKLAFEVGGQGGLWM